MTTSSPVTEPTPGHATVSSRKETDQQHIEQVEDDTKLQKSRADLSVAETMSPTAQQPSIDNAVHFARSEGGTKERNIRKAMKQPSLCQEDVANHSHHMSRRELTPAQSNQLAAVRDLWRGTTLVMNGGAFTGESREPQRKDRLMDQLILARRLRQDLEKAADRAEDPHTTTEKARQLILEMTPKINQLVSLTEAVRGNYTLDTDDSYYEEHNAWAQEDRQEHNKQYKNARSILRDQLRRMANPTKKWPRRTEVAMMSSTAHGSASHSIGDLSMGSHIGNAAGPSNAQGNDSVETDDRKPAAIPKPITEAIANIKRKLQKQKNLMRRDPNKDSNNSRQSSKSSASKKRRSEERETHDGEPLPDVATSANLPPTRTSSRKKTKIASTSPKEKGSAKKVGKKVTSSKVGKTVQPDLVRSGDAAVSPQTSSASQKSNTKTASPKSSSSRNKLVLGPKKCHNCKNNKTKWVKCQYLLPTGSKCGKYYCDECLKKDYGQSGKKKRENNDDSWHCPACLGNCKCIQCEKQRERDLKHTLYAQERQRSTRNKFATSSFP